MVDQAAKQAPSISVVIPSYNGKTLLQTCLASLAKQNRNDFEVIVIDNGSSDGTQAFLTNAYPWVRVFVSEEQLGFAKAANLGIGAARGRCVALLNNDTEVDPNWLTALKNRLDGDSSLGFCASKMLRYDQRHIIDGAGDVYSRGGNAFRLGWDSPDGASFQRSYRVFGACAAAVMYRKCMLDRIGLMDEDFMMYYEDTDLSFRAQLHGYRCEYVPEALVYHVGSASSGQKLTSQTLFLISRNSIYVIVKNYPFRLLVTNSARIALSRVRFTCSHLLRNPKLGYAYFKGMLFALGSVILMLKKRRVIQRSSTVSPTYIQELFKSSESQLKAVNG